MKKWSFIVLIALSPLLLFANERWEKYKEETLFYQKHIPGWCKPEKTVQLMNLIHETKPQICVEIGVFGGSSVYPMAAALRYQDQGVIYGIDPWEAPDCLVGYESDHVNYVWWNALDYQKIYDDFMNMINQYDVTRYCNVLRMNSQSAITHFQNNSIDILHIDGNHSEESSMRDVLLYLPKLKSGGFLWFDDANWKETQKTVAYLQKNLIHVPELSIGDECMLFKKP